MLVIHTEVKKVLMQLHQVLFAISDTNYCTAITVLDNASIGEHTRHVIELFQCLQNGVGNGVVNYDARQRNKTIQSDRLFAITCIEDICNGLIHNNSALQLQTILADGASTVESNYYRELIYNIEHCVHHQAIIKIGISSLGINLTFKDFGVAASTLQYKAQCVQ